MGTNLFEKAFFFFQEGVCKLQCNWNNERLAASASPQSIFPGLAGLFLQRAVPPWFLWVK